MDTLKAASTAETESPPHQYELARAHYFLGRGSPSEATPGRGREGERPKPPRPDRRGPDAPPRPAEGGPPGPDRPRPDNERHLRQAIQILEHLIEQHPSVGDYRHLLACCYRDLPTTRPDPSEGPRFESADKAIEILRQLVADFPDVPDYRLDLAKTYAKLDSRDWPRRVDSDAIVEDRLRQSLKITEQLLAEHPHVPEYTAAHVQTLYTLTEVLRHARRADEAETTLRRTLAVQSSLAEQFPQVTSFLVWKTILQDALAKMLADRGRTQEARALLESALTALKPLAQSEPKAAHIHGMLGRCYQNLSDVLRQMGEDEHAEEVLRRGRKQRIEQ